MPSSAAIARIESASGPERSRISRAAATTSRARGVSSSGALEAIGGAQPVADRAVEEDVEPPDESADEECRRQEADRREQAEGDRARRPGAARCRRARPGSASDRARACSFCPIPARNARSGPIAKTGNTHQPASTLTKTAIAETRSATAPTAYARRRRSQPELTVASIPSTTFRLANVVSQVWLTALAMSREHAAATISSRSPAASTGRRCCRS